ncbi:MAG: hypothetical protein KDA22_04805 [Phycisphaerales bacterium]|nr:hypothetical protein [Phycisphaerales bacterium]
MRPLTTVHVTHEACEKIGGIGAVLEGMITSPVYAASVGRTILIGPLFNHFGVPGPQRLGSEGEVLYSSLDDIDEIGLAARMRPIEWAFNVAIIYGRRRFTDPGSGRAGEAEVVLIDVFRINRERVDQFKLRLWEAFGLDSTRYEGDWGFEEYVRLAEPAFHAAMAILRPEELPAVLLSHEFMGLPTVFKAVLDGHRAFRSVFHAHECSTARHLVERHPGHDLAFYNTLHAARAEGLDVEQVFGDLSYHFRHALVRRAHVCDAIMAVGTLVAEEIHFLDHHFDHHQIDLVHNGIPAWSITLDERLRSRALLQGWAQQAVGFTPDLLLTHVTRPVVSKAIWRDFLVCDRLESRLAADGRRALLVVLTSAGGTRRPQDARQMAEEYGWPRAHREGYPDLVGPEIDLAREIERFNAHHHAVQAVLVNQFGWSGPLVGDAGTVMDFADLRRGADAEFGMAAYEPFGISPLEPLASGAVCVVSSVCGCRWFVESAAGGAAPENVVIADFTRWDGPRDLDTLRAIGRPERDAVEAAVAETVAARLHQVLPRTDEDRQRLLELGQSIVPRLGWDAVLKEHLLPTLRRLVGE